MMLKCATCGNSYDKMIEIVKDDRSHFYDCFECAIHDLAPQCADCGLKVIGHGVEVDGDIYCSAHCARKTGNLEVTDRWSSHQPTHDSEFSSEF